MKDTIIMMMNIIRKRYGLDNYVAISGDRSLKDIPVYLKKLLYSDASHNIAYCNMDYYYSRYRDGIISDTEIVELLIGLLDAFALEYERIYKANLMKGGKRHEGSKSVCRFRLGQICRWKGLRGYKCQ